MEIRTTPHQASNNRPAPRAIRPFLAATLTVAALLGSVRAESSPGYEYKGDGWSVTIGADGLMHSFQVGASEMLEPFPDHAPACLLVDEASGDEIPPFDSVEKNAAGNIVAKNSHVSFEYVFSPDRVEIKWKSFNKKTLRALWRPSPEVERAVDGEDDTSVIPATQTGQTPMMAARWFAKSGEVLTADVRPASFWIKLPFNTGVPCYVATLYPRNEGTWTFLSEARPRPITSLVLEIGCENPDFLPPGGAPAAFPAKAENLGQASLQVEYTLKTYTYAGHELVAETLGDVTLEAGAKTALTLAIALKNPGVYRSELELRNGGQLIKTKVWNFCYDFENWHPSFAKPADFDEFWRKTQEELAAVPAHLKRTVVSEDDKSTLYKVNYAVLNNERGYAWLRIPKTPAGKKLAARLQLPASGVNPLPAPGLSNAVEMYIAIHGFDVDASNATAKEPLPWPGGRYHNIGLASRDTYFYRIVIARCMRAVEILASLPEVDGDKIMTYGGSQGGGLAIITAALVPKIAFCVSVSPGLCRLDWTLRHEVGSWPLSKADIPAGQNLDQALATLAYYDVANFIKSVRCPIVGGIGWMDTVTAAGGQAAAFAEANKDNLTLYCAPWGRHVADARMQALIFQAQNEFLAGRSPAPVKTWKISDR